MLSRKEHHHALLVLQHVVRIHQLREHAIIKQENAHNATWDITKQEQHVQPVEREHIQTHTQHHRAQHVLIGHIKTKLGNHLANHVIQIVCLVIRQLVFVLSARMDIIHQGRVVSLVQLEHIHLMEYNALSVQREQQTVNQHNQVVNNVNQEHMRM